MLSGLTATGDLRGDRIDVAWVWSGLGERPAFRLVRRRRAEPASVVDGLAVFDLGELFTEADEPWERVACVRYLASGSVAEGGLEQASLAFFHDAPGDLDPVSVVVSVYDESVAGMVSARIDTVTQVVLALPAPAPWGLVEELEIFHAPGGGPEVRAGVVTVRSFHSDGVTPSQFRWTAEGDSPVDIAFDSTVVTQTTVTARTETETGVSTTWTRAVRLDRWDLEGALADPEDAPANAFEPDAVLTLREDFSPDTGDWTRSVHVSDLSAATEETSYYALFQRDPSDPESWLGDRAWRARATSTARYGFTERVYDLLPSVHRYYDEPTPEDFGQGQLRRFTEVFGVALDHLRGEAEALRTRHDVSVARGDFLPALGSWISWSTDRTAPLALQRSDIRMAPTVYETVGTVPNLTALATRVTGWKCEAKEFVHNLFMTNAPEAVPIRELWEIPHDGTDFGAPVRHTRTESFDGRPTAVPASAGTRLFWHSNRDGRWEIWTRLLAGDDSTEPEQLTPPADDELPPPYSETAPCALVYPAAGGDELWLVFESDRDGPTDIWARVDDGGGWGSAFRVTDHSAADRRPTAALGPANTLWVFWESERRGPTEIWSRTWDGAAWTPAVRVTESTRRDHEPAAALAADGRLWLAWRRDEADRSRLYTKVLDGGAWGPAEPLEDGPWRDESPALVQRGGELWLVWHSERTGRWELWGRVHDGAAWGAPFQITMRGDPDKEPFLLVEGADLRIFWRSEHVANEYRSRTVDTSDTELLEQRGRFPDRIHYTYDTEREELDWYARDVVGLYLTPPPGTPTEVVEEVFARARTYLDPFVPATVRVVLIAARAAESSDFFTDGVDGDYLLIDEFVDGTE